MARGAPSFDLTYDGMQTCKLISRVIHFYGDRFESPLQLLSNRPTCMVFSRFEAQTHLSQMGIGGLFLTELEVGLHHTSSS